MATTNRFLTVAAETGLFRQNGLESLEDFWRLGRDWVDKPNYRGDGWSAVSRHELALADGGVRAFYLKRQLNYFPRRSAPGRRRPLLCREVANLEMCTRLAVPALDIMAWGVDFSDEGCRAILVTEALDGYLSLDELANSWRRHPPDRKLRRKVLDSVASFLCRMHRVRIFHGNLYPKHIFICRSLAAGESVPVDGPATEQVKVIDTEDMYRVPVGAWAKIHDLEKLSRYFSSASSRERLRFFVCCTGHRKCGSVDRWILRRIVARGKRKQKKNRSLANS